MKKTTPILVLVALFPLLASAETLNERLAEEGAPALEQAASVRGCFQQAGVASFYNEPQRVACGGGRFNPHALTAAHRTLPCGTKVKVTNAHNGRSVVVTINDRGPYAHGRVIDLSAAAFRAIANPGQGVSAVQLQTCP